MTDSTDDTPESLRYGMVGEDQNTPEEKLEKYTGKSYVAEAIG